LKPFNLKQKSTNNCDVQHSHQTCHWVNPSNNTEHLKAFYSTSPMQLHINTCRRRAQQI